jgi:hypothetical protein
MPDQMRRGRLCVERNADATVIDFTAEVHQGNEGGQKAAGEFSGG